MTFLPSNSNHITHPTTIGVTCSSSTVGIYLLGRVQLTVAPTFFFSAAGADCSLCNKHFF